MKQELKSSHQRVELLKAARDALDARVQEVLELARSERESLGEYVRSAEDRALRDVDQARQEVRLLQAQLMAGRVEGKNDNNQESRHQLQQAHVVPASV